MAHSCVILLISLRFDSCLHACVLACVRASVRASVVRACVCACVRACVLRACVRGHHHPCKPSRWVSSSFFPLSVSVSVSF